MEKPCPFCSPSSEEVVTSNELCYARYDKYPVSPGHVLIIPFRHVASFFDLTGQEQQAAWELVFQMKDRLVHERQPDGFNVGINVGACAGQTVMHVHIHLIPRYRGDMQNPEGGVRGVIPEKRAYRKLLRGL
jgi:diadenosine tetraphosphate (Ap4A) HIT family hydrolase